MTENWKDIPRCPGYFASDCGRIKYGEKIFTGYVDPKGYTRVSVVEDGQRKNKNVARLVARAFLGEDNGSMVRHINGKPSDNRPENLKYGTAKDNYADSVLHGTNSKGEKHGRSKLKAEDVIDILNSYQPKVVGYNTLAKKYGISKRAVKLILDGKNWSGIAIPTPEGIKEVE